MQWWSNAGLWRALPGGDQGCDVLLHHDLQDLVGQIGPFPAVSLVLAEHPRLGLGERLRTDSPLLVGGEPPPIAQDLGAAPVVCGPGLPVYGRGLRPPG